MPVIPGVTVDFVSSPRIITVPEPIADISVQDLHDTIRDLEDEPNAMQYPHLIDSAGKEDLGGGVAVGITSTLQNAQLAFAARLGPTYIQCIVSGGNIVAVDANGDPISPIFPTAFTQVVIAASSSAVSTDVGALTLTQFVGLG